jgi:hypothetical protein
LQLNSIKTSSSPFHPSFLSSYQAASVGLPVCCVRGSNGFVKKVVLKSKDLEMLVKDATLVKNLMVSPPKYATLLIHSSRVPTKIWASMN